jgi:hypothetical protein
VPFCSSGLRCGPTSACCQSGQLCIDDACVTPGDACVDEIDCPIDQVCVVGLDRCVPRSAQRCEYFPAPGVFTPEQQWAWTGSTVVPESVNVMMSPAVGDLDGDRVPEVVFNTYANGTSYTGPGVTRIVRGDTGVEVRSIADPVVCGEHGVALGNLDGTGTAEIVTMLSPCSNGQMVAFRFDGTEMWRSHNADGTPFAVPASFGAPSIADLEGDGIAEVIIGAVVIEGDDGTVRWSARPTAGSGYPSAPASAVYDMDVDGDLEIVGGNGVWRADGSVLWENTSLPDAYVAVADFFDDGMPDIAVVYGGYVEIRRGTTGERIWPSDAPIMLPGGGAGGPPTIADFDGDGLPEIAVAGGVSYTVFNPDAATLAGDAAAQLWSATTQDGSSNITGSSVFDFDGNGSAEVVYNDECYMRVYAGTNGAVLAEVPQHSHTLIEYPLIVDVDADGNAEIVFAGNAEVNLCSAITGWDGLRAGVRVFRDAADNWVGTRTVWNQHAYSITHVRHDLSIPRSITPNWQRWNSFRQNPQSFDAPNLVPSMLDYVDTACPDSLELSAVITNRGAVSVSAGLAVTFYLGTPETPGRAVATVRTTEAILPGSSVTVRASFVPMESELGDGLPFFVRADDAGAGNGEHNECIETDNVSPSTYTCIGIQ